MSSKTIALFQSRSTAARAVELEATKRHLLARINAKVSLATAMLNEAEQLRAELARLERTKG